LLGLLYFVQSQQIGWEDRLQNDLFVSSAQSQSWLLCCAKKVSLALIGQAASRRGGQFFVLLKVLFWGSVASSCNVLTENSRNEN